MGLDSRLQDSLAGWPCSPQRWEENHPWRTRIQYLQHWCFKNIIFKCICSTKHHLKDWLQVISVIFSSWSRNSSPQHTSPAEAATAAVPEVTPGTQCPHQRSSQPSSSPLASGNSRARLCPSAAVSLSRAALMNTSCCCLLAATCSPLPSVLVDQHWGRTARALWSGQMLLWMAHPALCSNSKGDLVFPLSLPQVITSSTCLLVLKLVYTGVAIISTWIK